MFDSYIYVGNTQGNEPIWMWGSHRGAVVNMFDRNIEVSEFELKSSYYVHFRTITIGKGMNPLIFLLYVK